MIDVSKIKVGDKVKLTTDNWDDCQVFAVKGNVYTVVPRDNLAEQFFTKDTVEVDIFSYFDHHCEDFELVKEEPETTKSIPWKIKVLTSDYEYQGLYKGSIHVVNTFSSNCSVQFYHNGKLWTLDPEDYEHYVEQPLSEQDIREIKEVVDLFIPENAKNSSLDEQKEAPKKATEFLSKALSLLEERGKDYDQPEGERSMGKTVVAFNAITGHNLKESDGWLILQLLKDVRQNQNRDSYHADSAEDCISYAALKAEALAEGK